MDVTRILFLCTGNSCRSQMAEGFARTLGKGSVEAVSAGTDPRPVDPLAIKAMADLRVDIAQQTSKSLDQFRDQRFDFIISLCERASENCPSWPAGGEYMRWSIDDPATANGTETERQRRYHTTATQIRRRIEMLLAAHKIR
jgi:thioredoxin type arsenate reductase